MRKQYEVVISGMAGTFPEAKTTQLLEENLFNKKDMITNDDRKWERGILGVPSQTGKLDGDHVVDHSFFGIGTRLYETFDPHIRKSLEISFAAIADAGMNPWEMTSNRTATLACSCVSESEYEFNLYYKYGNRILGSSRSMQANRVAFHLNLRGPSLQLDNSWCGGAEAFRYACDMIINGSVDSAVVVACSLLFLPEGSYHYERMGRLNKDGCTKCYSDNADGYARSEACVAFFLQRKEDALRSYGTLLGTMTNHHGSKAAHFPEISQNKFVNDLKKFYSQINVDPKTVAYIEGAGVASKEIDAEELNSISDVMLEGREKPLLIGSLKSNLGHCEAASDMAAVAKALIAMNTGLIPPNLHYSNPNSLVPALVDGRLKVVTELTELPGDVVGVNNVTVWGSFVHIAIKRHEKVKEVKSQVGVLPPDGLPRLFVMSGRNLEDTEKSLAQVENMPVDAEWIALSQRLFQKGIKNHMFRAFTVINDANLERRETAMYWSGEAKTPLWFVFTGMGSQWPGMGSSLMKLPVFAKAINRCHQVLKPKGIDLIDIITTTDKTIFDNILHSFVGIAAVQIGLVDVLYELGIRPDGIIGHSVGELGCAYADGCLTAEQMLLAAYARGKASIETELVEGMMAAVGKGYKQMKKLVPDGIEVACHNSSDSCTLSGPTKQMSDFIEVLKAKNIFAKLVNVSNIAYHSRYIRPAAPALLKYLKEVIPKPLKRSSKWISTSVSEEHWDSELAQYCSAEYHTNNLLSSVLFEEGSKHVPQNAIIIEISPHGLLQAILKKSFPDAYNVPLTRRDEQHGLVYLFNAIGKLYLKGVEMDLEKIYPAVEYPVSRGTPCLGHLLNWEHSNDHQPLSIIRETTKVSGFKRSETEARTVQVDEGRFMYVKEYQLKGIPVIPLSSYLQFVIDELKNYKKTDVNFVQIKGVDFKKYVELENDDQKILFTSLQRGSGNWQICDDHEEVVKANIVAYDKFTAKQPNELITDSSNGNVLYENLRQLGLNLGPSFRLIKTYVETEDGITAVVRWKGSLVTFLESVLILPVIGHKHPSTLYKVWWVGTIRIDLQQFASKEERDITVAYSRLTSSIYCNGLEIVDTKLAPVFRKLKTKYEFHEAAFVPYESSSVNNKKEFLKLVKDILISNIPKHTPFHSKLNILKIDDGIATHDEIYEAFHRVPGVHINNTLLSEDKNLEELENFDNVLIVGVSVSVESAIQVLRKSNQGYILLRTEHIPKELVIILEKTIGPYTYSLCTMEKKNDQLTNYVFLTEDDWPLRVESAIKNLQQQVTYLVGSIKSFSRIRQIIDKCNDFYNAKQLRFLFHDLFLATKRVQKMIFQEQLNKGLRVNVFSRGKWGTVCFREMDIPTIPTHILHYPTYKLSQLRLHGVEIESLGLNLTAQLSVKSFEKNVVDYSGIQRGKSICGIGFVNDNQKTIEPDPILWWEKPMDWTHEEAASLILPYTMAAYVVREIEDTPLVCLRSNTARVLVHRGSFPLSQAVIDLCIRQKYRVFVSYIDKHEKQTIKLLFPEIPEKDILCIDELDLLFEMAGGCGMSCIVNTVIDENILKANSQLIGWNGIIFQTVFDNPHDKSLGLGMFLKAARVEGLKPSTVLFRGDKYKKVLHEDVEVLLKENRLKPLLHRTTSFQNTVSETYESLRDPKYAGQRLVASKKWTSTDKSLLHFCEPDSDYLIIVKDQGQIWVSILEWLIRRDAKRITIALDWGKQLQFVPFRLKSIMETNPEVNVNIHSEVLLSSPSLLETFINGMKKSGKLGAVFLTGEERAEKLFTLCEVIDDARMIYITDKFHEEFENQARNGLIIVDKNNSLYSDALLPVIDTFMQTSTKYIMLINCDVSTTTIVLDNFRTSYYQHLPWSVGEVISLGRMTDSAAWREVRTNTMAADNCHGLCPLLILPSMKKNVMKDLYNRLFNPAFEAILPNNMTSLDELAQNLYEGTKRFNNDVFTLVCSDWSYLLGLSLARLLEADGKQVVVVCFGSLIGWDSQVLYHTVCQKVRDELPDCPVTNRSEVEKGLEVLKERIELISQGLTDVNPKIKGTVILIKLGSATNVNIKSKLQEHCENAVVVQQWEGKYLEVVSSKRAADFINAIALVEHRDRAMDIEYYQPIKKYYNNPRRHLIQKMAYMLRK